MRFWWTRPSLAPTRRSWETPPSWIFGEDGNRAGFGVENQDRTVAASSDRDDGYCRD